MSAGTMTRKRPSARATAVAAAVPQVPHAMLLESTADGLVLFDTDRRTYLGLGRDGSYWHFVAPAPEHDLLVQARTIQAGSLTCSCISGRVRGTCYWTLRAEAFEAQHTSWFGERVPAVPS